ncbi:MAG: DoxX family protein [Mucilaginibacter sp.]|jgi:uncharacterized membrane protein YphA (DoxX/SURF4 family)|nr:DoxX family protein [Mucilaginibacter sp.]
MNLLLWIIQSLTALTFLYSGINKSIYSERRLVAAGQTGVEGLPLLLIRFIGIIEILGAIGLILPRLFGLLPIITPLTAIGFAIIMILAGRIHYDRKEPKNVVTNCILFTLCVFIAWYRF